MCVCVCGLFVCSTYTYFFGLIAIIRLSSSKIVCLKFFLFLFLLLVPGVESLETAINYWEDALAAYQSVSTGSGAVLLTSEEAEFCRSLERVLKVKLFHPTLLVFNFILVVLFFLGRLCPSRRDGTPLPARALCPVSNGSGGRLHFRRPDALLAHVVQFHFGRLVCFGPGRR